MGGWRVATRTAWGKHAWRVNTTSPLQRTTLPSGIMGQHHDHVHSKASTRLQSLSIDQHVSYYPFTTCMANLAVRALSTHASSRSERSVVLAS